jgi:hypothetical protein
MIFPWHTDLFQPGRTVCVVFRASPLIWPTSSGAHHAPRPLCFLRRQQGAPPVAFRAGLKVRHDHSLQFSCNEVANIA